MDCRSKCKTETVKPLEENIEKILCSWIRQTVLKYDTIGTIHKTKIDKMNITKTKTFCPYDDTVYNIKERFTEGRQCFANHIKIWYPEYIKTLNIQSYKRKLSLLELAKDLNRNYQRR